MKGLDLRRLKKVSSDDKSTTFRHEMGHEIKVAHDKLSPKMLSDLKKLPIHGQKMADGGEPDPQPNQSPDDESSDQSQDQAPVNININAQPQQQGPAPASAPNQEQQPLDIEPIQENEQNAAEVAPGEQDQAQAQPAASEKQEQPEPTRPQSTPNSPQQTYQNNMENLSTESAAFAQDLNSGHITPETYSDLFAKKSTLGKIGMIFGLMVGGAGAGMAHQDNALLKAMNQEINNDLDAQKQSKANAQNWLRLSQQHQMNQAQIAVQQQQAGLTKAQTQVALTQAGVNSQELAKSRMQYAVLHSLYQKTGMLPAGPQKAAATQVLGGLTNAVNQDVAQRNHQASVRAAQAQSLYGNQSEQQFNDTVSAMRMSGEPGLQSQAEDLQKRHFPGLGESSVPLSQEDRNKLTQGIVFQNQLDRFRQWASTHSGDLNPSDIKQGQALAAGLQGAYRQATAGGVYKSGEQDFIRNIINDKPTVFFNKIRVLPQLDAVKTDSAAQLDQQAKSLGFPGYAGATGLGEEPKTSAENEKTAVSKSGKPIVFRNGKWVYQ